MNDKKITLSGAELEDIIEKCIDRGVRKSLKSLGVDVDNPLEMQRDFQHLRDWRNAIRMIRNKGMVTAVGFVIAGTIALLVMGFNIWFRGAS